MSRDPRYTRLVNCARWRHLRDFHLATHPECAECLKAGIHTTADLSPMEVHHITPVEDALPNIDRMAALCYNPSNLVTLCRYHHHLVHTAAGYHKADKVQERKEQTADAYLHAFLDG